MVELRYKGKLLQYNLGYLIKNMVLATSCKKVRCHRAQGKNTMIYFTKKVGTQKYVVGKND